MSRRVPWVTFAVIAGALFIAVAPALQHLLIYDRERIFDGEAWRLFTGHFVHLSREHLVWNIAAFGMIGWMIEAKQLPRFGALCLVGPIVISAISLTLEPQMGHYAGLSALAMSALVFLAIHSVHAGAPSRAIGFVLLTFAIAKIAFELTQGISLFIPSSQPEIRVAALSHLSGAIVGVLFAVDSFLRFVSPPCKAGPL